MVDSKIVVIKNDRGIGSVRTINMTIRHTFWVYNPFLDIHCTIFSLFASMNKAILDVKELKSRYCIFLEIK